MPLVRSIEVVIATVLCAAGSCVYCEFIHSVVTLTIASTLALGFSSTDVAEHGRRDQSTRAVPQLFILRAAYLVLLRLLQFGWWLARW